MLYFMLVLGLIAVDSSKTVNRIVDGFSFRVFGTGYNGILTTSAVLLVLYHAYEQDVWETIIWTVVMLNAAWMEIKAERARAADKPVPTRAGRWT